MSRYIDVELLKNKILEDMAKAEREGRDCNGYTDALFHLKTMPTADVVEVKHGEWIVHHHCYECSICYFEYELDVSAFEYLPTDCCLYFCPCCGAKMDGERRTEQ